MTKDNKTFGQLTQEKQNQNRFPIKRNEMVLEEMEKWKVAQINEKRCCFSDGIVSLPISHPYLHEIVQFKKDKKQKNKSFLQEENHKLIQMEKFFLDQKQEFRFIRAWYNKNRHFIILTR